MSNNKLHAKDHESYNTMTLISFLIAPVGFILGIVYLAKSDPLERKLGEHMIGISILGGIAAGFIWYFFFPHYYVIL